jgi:hypothetical protein
VPPVDQLDVSPPLWVRVLETHLIRRGSDEPLVVRDRDNTSFERLERLDEGVNTLDVQMIRRLLDGTTSR